MKRVALMIALLALAACGDPATDSGTTDPAEAWSATIAYEAGEKLGGCAVGDFDPRTPGDEIAAVSVTGAVYEIRATADGWVGAEIARVDGEMIQCAIGDADPDHDGNELLIVGMERGTEDEGGRGAAHLVHFDGDAWVTETVFVDEALIHGGAIGDVDPRHPGAEIITVGFSGRAMALGKVDGAWQELWSHPLAAPAKTVVCADGVAWVANTGDHVVSLWADADGARGGTGPALGAAGARLSAHDGRLLVGCDDGGLRLIAGNDVTVLHQEGLKLRGAVLGDLDPLVDGIEAATAGYEATLTLLYPPAAGEGAWRSLVLFRDTAKFHHLAAGELTSDGLGPELVAVGYSGRVVVARRSYR